MSEEQEVVTLLERAAGQVRDPNTGKSVLLAGVVQNPRLDGERLRFDLVFTAEHSRDDRRGIEEALVANIRGLGFEGEVFPFARREGTQPKAQAKPAASKSPNLPGMNQRGVTPHGGPVVKKTLDGVKYVVCVASGKGGVGKSTVSANLAVALQRQGHKVGLLDADIYGPSVQIMMNVHASPMVDEQNRIIPVNSYGVRCLSAGMLVPAEQAIIWRGPMVMNLIRQFIQQARWGELDYLIIDLPPGTGDAQLTLIQGVNVDGAVIVSTPQAVALADAVRGISMFDKLNVPLLGLVENMAWYELPDGTRDYVFGEGGAVRLAEKHNTKLLGQLPLQSALRRSGDQGLPAALGDDALAESFAAMARGLVEMLPPEARETPVPAEA